MKLNLSKDWAYGFLSSSGRLGFYCNSKKEKIPSFIVKTGPEKHAMLILAAKIIGLRNKIYFYKYKQGKKNYFQALLIVRDVGQLKNIIIPIFLKLMFVAKQVNLEDWMEEIIKNKAIPERYKVLYRIYRSRFYSK